MKNWPFTDPENVAVVTSRQIAREGQAILLVSHDEEDGCWQFLTGGAFDTANGMLVSLKSIVAQDSSLLELADLPLGWEASRTARDQPWVRVASARPNLQEP